MTTEEEMQKPMLSDAEMAAVWRGIGEVAADHEQVNRPRPAATGRRWSDMPSAIKLATGAVETAVVEADVREGGRVIECRLMTVEGWPGRLVVSRVDGPDLYEAEAEIGRFPNEPARRERAEMLVKALDRALLALGRRPGFEDS
jgi:hypothetical protein